ncbi:PilZ domain-containing protein [Sphingomonas sinipercae]|uniref:PilZ domain-containing protein n=1 Tax=Sphingomonas sinipercae TaxID=2714944 RepID=A0A6G7ZME9_9SPHN|nr:PilZ domain-containing protein [Sphingomonas sinipercae]QIL02102.1 PilZ domain-containing protein [Sphingomonas sinipercae]
MVTRPRDNFVTAAAFLGWDEDRVEELPVRTTSYSLMRDVPAETDRRADDRHLTIFRVGSIVIGSRRELCLVKNLSAGGALVKLFSDLAAGESIQLEIREGQPIPGSVSWTRGNEAGLEFDAAIDVVDLLTSAGDGPRPRMPRVEVRARATIRQGAVVRGAAIKNISQGGLSVEPAGPLNVSEGVTVTLPGISPQQGVVRWHNGGLYGIRFNSVLGLPVLVRWLQEHGNGGEPVPSPPERLAILPPIAG